jgi:hypothetical protein
MHNNEPSLNNIDDYNGNESEEKRRTVLIVIAICLLVGVIYTGFKIAYDTPNDYIGTPEKPGINTAPRL